MKLFIALCIIFNTLACTSTPLTPEEEHARADALIVEKEQFWLKYDACLAKHGVVVFTGNLGRIRRPTMGYERPDFNIWEMRSAGCNIQ